MRLSFADAVNTTLWLFLHAQACQFIANALKAPRTTYLWQPHIWILTQTSLDAAIRVHELVALPRGLDSQVAMYNSIVMQVGAPRGYLLGGAEDGSQTWHRIHGSGLGEQPAPVNGIACRIAG